MDYEARSYAKIAGLVPASETFLELCSNADGIFPTAAFDALVRMKADHASEKIEQLIDTVDDQRFQRSEERIWFAGLENLIVDFDWRFQKDTAERLFGMLSRFGSVVCVGTPTVFSLLSEVRRTDILIDQNPYYKRTLSTNGRRMFCSAIEDFNFSDFGQQFEAALIDPPWNLVDYKSWLDATLPMIAAGGSLFVPIFPNLLREKIESDLWSIERELANVGQISILPFRVRYDTPTFEEEVLSRKGLPPLHGWRSAEMIEVRVGRSISGGARRGAAKPHWDRFEFGSTIVAVRTNHSTDSQSAEGHFFFLNSVSNRDKARHQITAVSSRNVATDFRNSSLLSKTLRSMSHRPRLGRHIDPLILASRNLGVPYD